MSDFNFGVVPRRSAHAGEAFPILRSDGVVILPDAGSSCNNARALAQSVPAALTPIVPDPAPPIKDGGGNRDRSSL